MQFARPENLWSLLVLLPMIGAYVAWWLWKLRLMDRVGERSLIGEMIGATSARRQVARAVLAFCGTALLCLAYAQPQWGQTNRPIKRTGVDVVFAMDLSQSMQAGDVSPNRLAAAKNEIETTLDVLRGDRVGLVVFTAVSFVQSPLTTDYGAIRFYLDRLEPGQMPLGGTSIGRAITDGVELLTGERVREDSAEESQMQRAKNQIIVLITDGEDHESDPLSAAQLASKEDIKVVTVGFGSKEGVRIPVYKPDGSLAGYKRDREGEIVRTKLDEETLEEVADRTGGRYIHYGGENSVANSLVDYINSLEKSELETLMKERYRERFAFFLVPGIILLILSLLLGERRGSSNAARKTATAAIVLAFTLFGTGCERAFEDTLSSVDDGNAAIEAGNYQDALEHYRRAETEIPARPELHYDIGRAHLGLEQWDDAADAFARALETDDLSLRFDALNNLGLAHAGNEAWRDAWETFTDALLLAARNPGAVDEERVEEARHNLGVAWRRLHPPCSLLEDDHEDNDEAAEATKLEEPKVEKATLCGLDDDWYVVGAIPGSTVSVKATFRDLREEPDPGRPFLPRQADLQIAAFDQTGEEVLVVDQGPTGEPATDRTATRTIGKFRVDETMVSGEMPHLLLKVNAAEHLEFEYDLEIVSIPPCHAMEEDSEDNDGPDQAVQLEPGQYPLHHCPADEDWFMVDVEMGDSFFVDVRPQPDPERETPPELSLEIYDPSDRVVARGEPDGGFITAGARAITRPGKYRVRIAGETQEEQGPYQMDLYQYEPCILGDDRFEENDSAAAAAKLDPQQPVQRYLRACGGDRDFYRIDFGKDDEKKVHLGLSLPTIPAPGRSPTDQPEFDMDLVSASGDQILVPGKKPQEAPPAPDDTENPTPPMSRVLLAEDVEGDSAIVRVIGDNEFYHLQFLDPQQPDQNQDQQDQKKDQDQDGEQKPSESENEKDDSQGQEEQSSEKDQGDDQEGESGDEKPPEPEEKNPGERGDPDPKDQEQEEQKKQAERPGEEDPEMKRIDDILEALQQTDDNFQMRKALENMPGRYIEKDW